METKLEKKISELAELYQPYQELIDVEFFEDFDQKLVEDYLTMLIDLKALLQKPIQKAYSQFEQGEFLKPKPLIKLLFICNQIQNQIETISLFAAEKYGIDNIFKNNEE